MKRIIINESQKKRLLEGYQPKFSFKKLEELYENEGPFEQYRYCNRMLGRAVNHGSSRVVYTLDDNMVLKLAGASEPDAGIDQNTVEYKLYEKCHTPLLPRIYYHDKYYSFLVCESVLPAQMEDFEKILGIPWFHNFYQNTKQEPLFKNDPQKGDKKVGYNKYFVNIKEPYKSSDESAGDVLLYIEDVYALKEGSYDKSYEEIINRIPWFQEIKKLVVEYGLEDFGQIENFGIVNRDGNPTIVILDSGLDEEVYNKHYA